MNSADFIGHVDAGKSTLMGRLLYDLKVVDQRTIDRYRKEAEKMGKSSFALAWVLDQGSEERSRGVTIDIATNKFETEKTAHPRNERTNNLLIASGKGGKGPPKTSSEKRSDQIANGVEALRVDDTPKAKSKNLDVLAEFEKRKAKNAANFVVIGRFFASFV